MPAFRARFLDGIDLISKEAWNDLAGTGYPFLRHEFLEALESSGSAGPDTGWTPQHFTLYDERGTLVAIAPCYLKDHSFGEYVFDWAWADAYHRYRLDYYPKLITAIPFTPSTGPRLIIGEDQRSAAVYRQSLDAILDRCRRRGISSWHLLFPPESFREAIAGTLQDAGLLERIGVQYHWFNRDFGSFADYLGAMTSRKRKNIRRERERVAEQGITFQHVGGAAMTAHLLDIFYLFYHATYFKRGGQGYLNRRFFEVLLHSMPETLLFIFAYRAGEPVAVALNFRGADTLYGRYWGCLESYKHLHFETCYYQGIEYSIAHGLHHFDAGAQGEHKIQRGFEPISTHSYHWIAHPGFRGAIEDFLAEERTHMRAFREEASLRLPFKQAQ